MRAAASGLFVVMKSMSMLFISIISDSLLMVHTFVVIPRACADSIHVGLLRKFAAV